MSESGHTDWSFRALPVSFGSAGVSFSLEYGSFFRIWFKRTLDNEASTRATASFEHSGRVFNFGGSVGREWPACGFGFCLSTHRTSILSNKPVPRLSTGCAWPKTRIWKQPGATPDTSLAPSLKANTQTIGETPDIIQTKFERYQMSFAHCFRGDGGRNVRS